MIERNASPGSAGSKFSPNLTNLVTPMPPAAAISRKPKPRSPEHSYWKERFADPVAGITGWDPLGEKASRFLTHRLVRIHDRHWELRATPIAYLACLALFVLSLCFLFSEFIGPFRSDWSLTGFIAAVNFGTIAFNYRKRLKRIIFDKDRGCFLGGKNFQPNAEYSSLSNFTPLDRIHALQLLTTKPFYGKGRTSQELNLILTNGSRINLLDLAKPAAIRRYATDLGSFLGKPIWEAERSGVMPAPSDNG